jgi:hypothetical protein
MIQPFIIRLYRQDGAGICAYEDETRQYQRQIFMPVAAILELDGDGFGYFEAWPKGENSIDIGRRLPDQGWSA